MANIIYICCNLFFQILFLHKRPVFWKMFHLTSEITYIKVKMKIGEIWCDIKICCKKYEKIWEKQIIFKVKDFSEKHCIPCFSWFHKSKIGFLGRVLSPSSRFHCIFSQVTITWSSFIIPVLHTTIKKYPYISSEY